jgi:hypothetical protein
VRIVNIPSLCSFERKLKLIMIKQVSFVAATTKKSSEELTSPVWMALKAWEIYAFGRSEKTGSLAWQQEQEQLNLLSATHRLSDGLSIDVPTLYRLNAFIELVEMALQSIGRYSEHTQMTFSNARASLNHLFDQVDRKL